MKKLLGGLLVIGALLCMSWGAAADCARFQRVRVVHHAPAAVVHHAAAAVIVPVYQPSYTVTYDPTGGAAGLALLEELKALRAEVRDLKSARPPEGGPAFMPPAVRAPVGVFANKCARCHDADRAAAAGAPILMSKGVVLNKDRIPERMMEAIRTGKMGGMKLPALTAEEKLEGIYTLFDLPAAEAAPPPAPAVAPKS